jgi:hypothetical protein
VADLAHAAHHKSACQPSPPRGSKGRLLAFLNRGRPGGPLVSQWRESSTPIPHRGSHPTSGWLIQLGALREPIARPGLGTCRRFRAHPQVGDGPRGRVRRQVPRPVLAEGVASGPPHVGHRTGSSPNASFRAVLGYHRTPPWPVGVRQLTDLLGYRPPTSHTPTVVLRLEAGRPIFPASPEMGFVGIASIRCPNTCLSRSGPGVLLLPSRAI